MGHRYDYEIELGDGSGPDRVVRMVGTGKRVLDLGAGPGSISRILRERFHCRITAVEIDEEAIPRLAPACEQVYRVDLNDESWPDALRDAGLFDVVVAADVLEHLYDPWTALDRMKDLIDQSGCLVVSLPHAGYSGMLASLLDNDFEYRDSGLLDRTHLRFFGVKNAQALFDNAGLSIVDAEFVTKHPESTEFADVWRSTPPGVRIGLLKNRFSRVYQVVIKAVPASSTGRSISLLELGQNDPGEEAGRSDPVSAEIREGHSEKAAASPEEKRPGDSIRLIAFFLTQFHPVPENDRWWGKGFTEWTNVTKAEPLFGGHYQPRLPADLGFYDLRLREVRHEQIAMAREYGIDGFCYHYYWFSGTRILNRPLDDMLNDPESDMPFCLCWANENWTRRWDGVEHEVLLGQKYLPGDDRNFIKGLAPILQDSRYIRLRGAPLLIVYQPQLLPDPVNSAKVWREYCDRVGVGPIHLCAALTSDNEDYSRFGFDSGIQFPPHNHACANVGSQIDFYTPFHGVAVEYSAFARSYMERTYPNTNVFRAVCPSWDQTPRVGSRAFLTLNATPANYEYWLSESIARTRQDFPGEERFVFINAWNEWAEGCHLEPDRRFERQFLEATFRAKTGESRRTTFEDTGPSRVASPLTSTEARLAELEEELALERDRLTRLEAELSEERERLSMVYQDSSAKSKEITNKDQALLRKQKQLSDAQQKFLRKQKQLSDAQQKLQAQLERLTAAEEALSEIYASRSWRLTRPLRDAFALFRRKS